MYEAAARSLRTAERFLIAPALNGRFASSPVLVSDISVKGARFRHAQPVEMGQKSLLQVAIEGLPPTNFEAVVVWTKPDPITAGRFMTGVRTYVEANVIDGVLAHLQGMQRTTRIEELRSTDRFDIAPSVEGEWNGAEVRVENLSARGGRIETARPLAPSSTGTLTFAVAELTVSVAAAVAWSTMKSVNPSMYRSGLIIDEKPELLRLAIGHLCEAGVAILDTHSLALKLKVIRARARQLASQSNEMSGVPTEQYLLIQCVREELRLNPDEAMHWYRRARLTIADPATRTAAPAIADHPDALAVWEYLDRSIDPSIIGRTFELP
ncbi:MAG TPA: PilZ domain-containing protein [Thermoanaerobaculia bacterium]|nr:PilZ domain-containing protein [Thermoanaerobaculia bacterium]